MLNMNNNKRMLISGGNGFLGSHLVDKAISEGFSVVVVDDMSTMSKVNIPPEAKLIRERIEDVKISDKFDYYIHLAARPSPEDYIANPVETMLSNSLGTFRMLELARRDRARFVYTSSSETYGDAEIIPTPETYYGRVNFTGIRSCYDEGKRYSEALAMSFLRQYDVDIRIQRPFNVYGPRIRPDGQYGRVIPRFISQALSNSDITIHGDGNQTRSFLYISDWLDATWKMIINDDLKGEIFNIGSTKEYTINELAETVRRITGSRSRIVHIDGRIDDPRRRSADITKAIEKMGWSPKISLEEGLKYTIEWIKSENK